MIVKITNKVIEISIKLLIKFNLTPNHNFERSPH